MKNLTRRPARHSLRDALRGWTPRKILFPLVLAGLSGPALHAQETGPAGTVLGLVYDSTAGTPLAGARVVVFGTTARTDSDEDGRFRFDGISPGEYSVSFFHPRLGTLGVSGNSQKVVVTGGGVSEAYLTVPSRATILRAWCSAEPGSGDTSVGGLVTDQLTGVALPGARVEALGRRGILQQRAVIAEQTTGNTGEYSLCNLDLGDGMTIEIVFGNNAARPVAITQPGSHVLDVAIPISEPVTITGSVTDYATGAPIPGASVQLAGSEFQAFADSAGRFGFARVPPGKQVIVAEQLGYAPRTDTLTVFSREALGIEIVLATEAIVLEPIVVTGRRKDLFLAAPGVRFSGLTEAQVDSIVPRAFNFAALARAAAVPGVLITERRLAGALGQTRTGLCIEMLRRRRQPNACNMVGVRLNDTPLADPAFLLFEMNPQDIRSIQFISPSDAGMLYGASGVNGMLLIYTR